MNYDLRQRALNAIRRCLTEARDAEHASELQKLMALISHVEVYTLHIHQGSDFKYYVRVKAGNGKIVGDLGQGFTRRDSALKAARRMAGATLKVAE